MLQVQIFIDKDDLIGIEPLHQFIMKLLMENEITGATSFTGYSGFGKNQKLKRPGMRFSFDETPMLITFIDEEEKVNRALSVLREKHKGGLIITHKVENWIS